MDAVTLYPAVVWTCPNKRCRYVNYIRADQDDTEPEDVECGHCSRRYTAVPLADDDTGEWPAAE